MNKKVLVTVAALALWGGLTMPRAKADEWNKKTVFTFNEPVEIPGQVLSAGTYVFKLLDSQSDRHVVQIFNKNETHLFATILAIPDYRLQPTGKTILTFEERVAGSPQAIKAWFYPGDAYGDEFVYPKVKAVELARQNNQPVPSMPNANAATTTEAAPNKQAPAVTAMSQAPLKVQKPAGDEVEVGEVYVAPTAPQQTAQNNPPAQTPAELPKTGSSLGFIALAGLICLASAFSLKLVKQ
jgi:LPXTG-motif cell wall-anchored protein